MQTGSPIRTKTQFSASTRKSPPLMLDPAAGPSEYSVFTSSRRPATIAGEYRLRFCQSKSLHFRATSSEHLTPVQRARITMVRQGSRLTATMRRENCLGVRIRGFVLRFEQPSIRTRDRGVRSVGRYSQYCGYSTECSSRRTKDSAGP